MARNEVISKATAAFKNGTEEEQVEALQELKALGTLEELEDRIRELRNE